MVKVRIQTLAAGPDGVVRPDTVGTFTKEQAEQLVAGRYGVYETTSVKQSEATVKIPPPPLSPPPITISLGKVPVRKKSAKRKRK